MTEKKKAQKLVICEFVTKGCDQHDCIHKTPHKRSRACKHDFCPIRSTGDTITPCILYTKPGGFVATLSFDKSRGIPVNEFCALVEIVTKKHGEGAMISVQDKDGHMNLTKEKKHLGYIDINTGSLVWDKKEGT